MGKMTGFVIAYVALLVWVILLSMEMRWARSEMLWLWDLWRVMAENGSYTEDQKRRIIEQLDALIEKRKSGE